MNTSWRKITRRTVLRGTGGAVVGLPFLEATARNAHAATPKRLIVYVHPQGTFLSRWRPAQPGPLGDLPQMLAPLAPLKSKVNVWGGITNRAKNVAGTDAHMPANRSLLSAHTFVDRANQLSGSAGPSIDYYLASKLNAGTPLKNLDLQIGGPNPPRQMQFSAPNVRVSAIADPMTAWSRLSSGFGQVAPSTDPPEVLRLRAQRRSLLDAVYANFKHVRGQLGAADRLRLDAHADRMKETEATLLANAQPAAPGACNAKAPTAVPTATDKRVANKVSRAHAMNALAAITCDQSRVVTMLHTEDGDPTFDWLGVNLGGMDWHNRVHQGGGNNVEGAARAFQWYGEEVAFLATELDKIDEGGSTALDNTMILWLSEFGSGSAHSTESLPVVVIGGKSFGLKSGRYIDFGGRKTTNDLYVTLLKLFGLPDDSFGISGSDFNTGPLAIG